MLGKSVTASSMGRVLDAVSCILGICCKRTYEGEPAIKLERWIEAGKQHMQFDFGFDKIESGERARTLPMFEQLLRMKIESDADRADAAASFVKSLVAGLADRACEHAREHRLRQVGLSGGVSFSGP